MKAIVRTARVTNFFWFGLVWSEHSLITVVYRNKRPQLNSFERALDVKSNYFACLDFLILIYFIDVTFIITIYLIILHLFRRLASNRNIFISPVKQQVNLSPKRVIFTVGRSTGKDLQDVNLMISSAERRASMANLTMGLKRPVLPSLGSNTSNSSVFTMSTGGGVGSINTPGGTSRTVTLVGPNGFTTKRIDFNI